MLVGEDQSLGRHQAAGRAAEAHRAEPDPIEPGLVDAGVEVAIGRVDREIVEGPHAFRGGGGEASRAKAAVVSKRSMEESGVMVERDG